MNMKRILSLALMTLLLCLPVWAMAARMEIEGRVVITPDTLLTVMGNDELLELEVTNPNATIVFDGVNISDGQILISGASENVKSVKIELIGDNSISTEAENGIAITSEIPLTIAGEGSLTCTSDSIAISCYYSLTMQSGKLTAEGVESGILVEGLNFSFLGDELTVEGGDDYGGIAYLVPNGDGEYTITNSFTLPEYSSAPAGYTFKAWSVNGKEMQPGDIVDTASGARVSVKPVFEKMPELPKTGDDSNVILWSALVFASVIGMTMLVRKRKEA